jgi:hypothetical protein
VVLCFDFFSCIGKSPEFVSSEDIGEVHMVANLVVQFVYVR